MKAFITGGAGFIGSNLIDALINRGHNVTVYDDFSSGSREYLKQHNNNPNFKCIEGDVLDKKKIIESIGNSDVVFHLAANPHISKGMTETDLDLRLGIVATYNVLEAMRIAGIKKIVFSSSGVVYGDVGTKASEDFGPLLPVSMYGASKLGSEGMISAFCNMFDMQAWIFRFANVVGEKQTKGVIYDFVKKLKAAPHELEIFGDGNQSKPYIHVSDVIDAVLLALEKSDDNVNLFNIATNDSISVNEIAQIIIEKMGLKNVKLRYTGGTRGWKGDVPKVAFDVTKIHNLGWKAKYNSFESIRKSLEAMLGD